MARAQRRGDSARRTHQVFLQLFFFAASGGEVGLWWSVERLRIQLRREIALGLRRHNGHARATSLFCLPGIEATPRSHPRGLSRWGTRQGQPPATVPNPPATSRETTTTALPAVFVNFVSGALGSCLLSDTAAGSRRPAWIVSQYQSVLTKLYNTAQYSKMYPKQHHRLTYRIH